MEKDEEGKGEVATTYNATRYEFRQIICNGVANTRIQYRNCVNF